MATPNLLDKACMSSGIDQPSFVYVDSKKDNFVKAPFTLLVDLSGLAARAAPARSCGVDFKSACAASESAFSPNRSRRAEKSIAIRLDALLLRQNLFDQLEYRREFL